ncbi:hypothetical protein B0E47_12155 [Rhodanobacter sp. B05]|uniref:restriction endonuclease subunit S n=1 Tax=Rhodanobacter sp. B05 TaxID=1945859 RepID=UPI0009865B7B|nr:restriction endonuclease subunit S [Rhodanobacter sp. B05]OOG53938.1 hypothetical protein B0E47_12155 [Rhodanobacter sp. B05]
MIAGLKPYAAYKVSELVWLPSVPKKWTIRRGRGVFECIDKRSIIGDEELLSVSAADGVRRRSEKAVTMFQANSYAGHKLAWPGDLVINSLWAWMKGLGFSKYHGIVSTAYGVYRLRPEHRDGWQYFNYLLRSNAYDWELRVRSKGIWISRMQLTDWSFLDTPILLPPPHEQAAIVRFLDHANRKIDSFIRAKRKLIALLNEQKQAIIHRAVTRGLNPDVPLKPSGIDWVGDVPVHWGLPLLGRCLTGIEQGWSPVAAEGDIVPEQWCVLTLSSVRRGVFNPAAIKPVSMAAAIPRQFEVADGDLLLTRSNTRDRVGDVCLVKGARPRTLLCDLIYRLRLRSDAFDPQFLVFQLLSQIGRQHIERDARGSSGTMPKISQGHIKSWRVLLPPMDEQQCIVEVIEAECAPIERTVAHIEHEISLMQEYRTRLTADIVTGKLDVRAAVASLPEIVDAPVDEPVIDETTDELEYEDAE